MTWAPPGLWTAMVGWTDGRTVCGSVPGTATRARTVHCSYQPGSPGRNQTTRGGTMRGLDGRTYIVTGAASGIGRATAARLLEEGANVMGADVTDEVATPSTGDGGRWDFARTDVTDEGAVEALVRAAV